MLDLLLVFPGLTSSDLLVPRGGDAPYKVAHPSTFIKRNSSTELTFVASGTNLEGAVAVPMVPLFQIMEEAYAVYFKTDGFSEVMYV